MYDAPSAATDLARNVPLSAGAMYLTFVSEYGAVIVTTLAIVFGVMQIVMRVREHRAIMRKNKEAADVSNRE